MWGWNHERTRHQLKMEDLTGYGVMTKKNRGACRHLWKKVKYSFLQKQKISISWKATNPWQWMIIIVSSCVLQLATVVITGTCHHCTMAKNANVECCNKYKRWKSLLGFFPLSWQQRTTCFCWFEKQITSLFSEESRGFFAYNIPKHVIECVVPENIHTPTTEGIGNLRRGGGVKDPGNSRGEGVCMIGLVSRGIPEVLWFNTDLTVDQTVQKSFLTY